MTGVLLVEGFLMNRSTPLLGLLGIMAFSACATVRAKDGGKDFITPPETKSPDGRYAVMVPVFHEEAEKPDERKNQVVDLKGGEVVAVIQADPGYDRALNHHGMGEARWSKDGSLLFWKVDGKWTPDALVLLKLEDKRAKWQLDVLKAAQQALLERTRKAAPEKYFAAKKANEGSGSAFPDGFTVYVTVAAKPDKPLALPLTVYVDLTANPKGIEDFPVKLHSYLDATVAEDGSFVIKYFHLGARKE